MIAMRDCWRDSEQSVMPSNAGMYVPLKYFGSPYPFHSIAVKVERSIRT